MCGIGQGFAVFCRWLFFATTIAAIVLSFMTVGSCHFIEYLDSDGKEQYAGLFQFYDRTTKSCVAYDDNFMFDESENAARVSAVLAPLTAFAAVLLVLLEFCCCRFFCSRFLIGFGLMSSLIFQGITLLWLDSDQFCGGDIMNEILHQEPCSISHGAIYSAVAVALYFVTGCLIFCTPKPEPMRTRHKQSDIEPTTSDIEESSESGSKKETPELT
eukprot:CAMPEP_0194031928 /NCGR_PEP_ID=MMETSP0009_2-20130614/4980_1 /TAXON_ID=210454 /ORGANISM="Grammatophora oceanica, Strain CCMP 410" /LENGTH=214 /DNA_ID=CAMNT_0038672201 /DNA_START=102 /DNA_END=746 /DNA_ORIENTATION=+